MGKKYTEEFLLSELRRFYEENGRSPTAPDMRIKNGFPPATAYYKYFNSFTNALICANLKVNHLTGYTNKQLIQVLQDFYNTHGRSPLREDIINIPNSPSYSVYVDRFGSFTKALEAADIPINVRQDINKAFLIKELHRFVDEFGKTPTTDDLKNNSNFPCSDTYLRHFGSFNSALIEANLPLNLGNQYTKEYLLNEIKRFVLENNRVPEYRDLLPINGYPTAATYIDNFGSFNNALIECGFKPNRIIHEYDGSEFCSNCGSTNTYDRWHYDENDNRLCCRCTTKIWFKNNPLKLQMYKHKSDSKHRGYGVAPINEGFYGANGHHLWLEDDAFTIFMPEFLHQMHWHSHHKQDTLITPNALALDYWVNEEFYNNLYLTGEVDG